MDKRSIGLSNKKGKNQFANASKKYENMVLKLQIDGIKITFSKEVCGFNGFQETVMLNCVLMG